MLAYQISVNGKPVGTAGVQQGVVSAIANWVSVPASTPEATSADWHAGFSLAGLDTVTSEHLKWFRCDVQVGDEISIKLIEVGSVDEPTHRESRPERTPSTDAGNP
jgi:hypothetical protein